MDSDIDIIFMEKKLVLLRKNSFIRSEGGDDGSSFENNGLVK